MDTAALALGVAGVTVAPIAGFGGVLAGSRSTARHAQDRWLREQRLELASETITAVAALSGALNIYVRLALQKDPVPPEPLARAQMLWDSWLVTHDRALLIFPANSGALAVLFEAVEEFYDLTEKTIEASGQADDTWDDGAMAINFALRDFRAYAQELIQQGESRSAALSWRRRWHTRNASAVWMRAR